MVYVSVWKEMNSNYFFSQYTIRKKEESHSIEALLRTNTPSLSKYNILQIIQTAEATGQIIEIDKWVIKASMYRHSKNEPDCQATSENIHQYFCRPYYATRFCG